MEPLFDSRQILAFSMLAQTGSFTQAARNMGVSQSAVSHAIGALERKVGCRLFERNSRHVQLTLAGEQFLHHVGKINDEMAAAYSTLQLLRTWGQMQLRIAAPASVSDLILPHCLAEVRSQYPNSLLSVVVSDRHEAFAELMAGRVDLAITLGPETDDRFECQSLFTDELGFVFRPDHPWRTEPPMTPAAVGSEPLLTYRRATYTRQLIQEYFATEGIEPTVVAECDSTTAVREMVLRGMGVGVLPRWVVATEVAEGRLVCRSLGSRSLTRQWVALSLQAKRLSLPQTLLIEEIRRCGSAIISSLQCIEGVTSGTPPPTTPMPLNHRPVAA